MTPTQKKRIEDCKKMIIGEACDITCVKSTKNFPQLINRLWVKCPVYLPHGTSHGWVGQQREWVLPFFANPGLSSHFQKAANKKEKKEGDYDQPPVQLTWQGESKLLKINDCFGKTEVLIEGRARIPGGWVPGSRRCSAGEHSTPGRSWTHPNGGARTRGSWPLPDGPPVLRPVGGSSENSSHSPHV